MVHNVWSTTNCYNGWPVSSSTTYQPLAIHQETIHYRFEPLSTTQFSAMSATVFSVSQRSAKQLGEQAIGNQIRGHVPGASWLQVRWFPGRFAGWVQAQKMAEIVLNGWGCKQSMMVHAKNITNYKKECADHGWLVNDWCVIGYGMVFDWVIIFKQCLMTSH